MQRIANKHDAYRRVGVHTADPGRILLMLYDGCIKFCRQAQERITANDMEGKGKRISDAQAILYELLGSLNHTASPDLCDRLTGLYNFMIQQLSTANVECDPAPVDVVVDLLSTLRAAWAEVVAGQGAGAGQAAAAPGNAPDANALLQVASGGSGGS